MTAPKLSGMALSCVRLCATRLIAMASPKVAGNRAGDANCFLTSYIGHLTSIDELELVPNAEGLCDHPGWDT